MEDYTGKDSTEVFRDLNKKGIKWTEKETYSNEYPSGTVVEDSAQSRWKRWQRAMKSASMSA